MEIRAANETDPALVLDAINDSFGGAPRSLDWYRWKHLDGPWGPSVGRVAVSDEKVVGVRLFTPWEVLLGDEHLPILRALDGAVRPSARRQGLFSRLIGEQVTAIRTSGDYRAIYSTAVPASREAYRKLGWSVFDAEHTLTLVAPRRTAVVDLPWPFELDDALLHTPASGRVATLWSAASLRWRTDPRSGYHYRMVRLRSSSTDHGLILRVAGSGPRRVIVLVHAWGAYEEVASAVRAAAWHLRTPAVLSTGHATVGPLHRSHGTSSVCLWTPNSDGQQRLATTDAWDFSFADLEGVM